MRCGGGGTHPIVVASSLTASCASCPSFDLASATFAYCFVTACHLVISSFAASSVASSPSAATSWPFADRFAAIVR